MLIEEAIYSHLSADTNLAAMHGGRVYPVVRPQGSALPAVVFQKISSVTEYAHDGAAGQAEARFQITAFAAGYLGAKQLADKIKKAFVGFERAPGTMGGAGGVKVAGVFRDNELDIYGAEETETLSLYQIPIDYLVQHEED